MRKVIQIMCLLLITLLITGCTSDEERIVGTWWREDKPSLELRFYENGTCAAYENGKRISQKENWYIDDDRLVIEGQRVEYKLNGSTLTFTIGGETTTWYKTR